MARQAKTTTKATTKKAPKAPKGTPKKPAPKAPKGTAKAKKAPKGTAKAKASDKASDKAPKAVSTPRLNQTAIKMGGRYHMTRSYHFEDPKARSEFIARLEAGDFDLAIQYLEVGPFVVLVNVEAEPLPINVSDDPKVKEAREAYKAEMAKAREALKAKVAEIKATYRAKAKASE